MRRIEFDGERKNYSNEWRLPIGDAMIGRVAGMHVNSRFSQFTQFTDSPIHRFCPLPHNRLMHTFARLSVAAALVAIVSATPRRPGFATIRSDPAGRVSPVLQRPLRGSSGAGAVAPRQRDAGSRERRGQDLGAALPAARAAQRSGRSRQGQRQQERGAETLHQVPGRAWRSFMTDLHHGQALARSRLKAKPDDEDALFFLGKLDLNFVWLELGLLGHKTGWDEYWEARRSPRCRPETESQPRARPRRPRLDRLHRQHPDAVGHTLGARRRQQEARHRGSCAKRRRWRRDPYTRAEAEFALWDMNVREKNFEVATAVAEKLARDFPENQEVAKFLAMRRAAKETR